MVNRIFSFFRSTAEVDVEMEKSFLIKFGTVLGDIEATKDETGSLTVKFNDLVTRFKDLNELKLKYKDLTQENKSIKKANARMSIEIDKLNKKVLPYVDLDQKYSELLIKRKSLEQQRDDFTEQIENITKRLAMVEKTNKLEADNSSLNESVNLLERKAHFLRNENRKLDSHLISENFEIAKKRSTNLLKCQNALQKEVKDLEEDISNMQELVNKHKIIEDSIKRTLSTNRSLELEVKALCEKQKKLMSQKEKLAGDIANLEFLKENVAKYNMAKKPILKSIDCLNLEISCLKDELGNTLNLESRSKTQADTVMEGELTELNHRLRDTREELRNYEYLVERCKIARSEFSNIFMERALIECKIPGLDFSLRDVRATYEDLQKQCEKAKRKHNKACKRNTLIESEITELNRRNKDMTAEIETMTELYTWAAEYYPSCSAYKENIEKHTEELKIACKGMRDMYEKSLKKLPAEAEINEARQHKEVFWCELGEVFQNRAGLYPPTPTPQPPQPHPPTHSTPPPPPHGPHNPTPPTHSISCKDQTCLPIWLIPPPPARHCQVYPRAKCILFTPIKLYNLKHELFFHKCWTCCHRIVIH